MSWRARNLLVLTILVLLAATSLAETPSELEAILVPKLKGGLVVLRIPRVGRKLQFDEKGDSKDRVGMRGIDDIMIVRDLRVSDRELRLEADRLQMYYDFEKKATGYVSLHRTVSMRIAMPTTSDTEARQRLRTIFLAQGEIRRCSDLSYLDTMKDHWAKLSASKDSESEPLPPVERCFPTGSTGYQGYKSDRFEYAKPVKTPDPAYPNGVPRGKGTRTVVLAMRVDEEGKISDAVMLKAMEAGFDEATEESLRKWVFTPAKLDGKPVASVMSVEFNFSIY